MTPTGAGQHGEFATKSKKRQTFITGSFARRPIACCTLWRSSVMRQPEYWQENARRGSAIEPDPRPPSHVQMMACLADVSVWPCRSQSRTGTRSPRSKGGWNWQGPHVASLVIRLTCEKSSHDPRLLQSPSPHPPTCGRCPRHAVRRFRQPRDRRVPGNGRNLPRIDRPPASLNAGC